MKYKQAIILFMALLFDTLSYADGSCPEIPSHRGVKDVVTELLINTFRVVRLDHYTAEDRLKIMNGYHDEMAIYIEESWRLLGIPGCIENESDRESLLGFIGLLGVMYEKYPNENISKNEDIQNAFNSAFVKFPSRTREQRNREWSEIF